MMPSRSTWSARESSRALLVALAVLSGCAGAHHPKMTGPPPEYEPPDLPDASFGAPGEPGRDASSR
jgi:hypothetical protein